MNLNATLLARLVGLSLLPAICAIIPLSVLLVGIDAHRQGRAPVEVILWALLTALVVFIGLPLYLLRGRKTAIGQNAGTSRQ